MEAEEATRDAAMVLLVFVLFLVTACGVCHGLYYRRHYSHEYMGSGNAAAAAAGHSDKRKRNLEMVETEGTMEDEEATEADRLQVI